MAAQRQYQFLIDDVWTKEYLRTILKDNSLNVNYNYNWVMYNIVDDYN